MSTAAASYWCYRCTRVVRVVAEESVVCPRCDGGFVEAVEPTSPSDSTHRIPAVAMYMVGNNPSEPDRSTGIRFRRGRRNNGDRSPFNPVIVLRGPPDGGGDENSRGGASADGSFEFYYDDGAGSGLRPLPETMSDFLMGSGFDRLLDQLSQIEINGLDQAEQPPASKASIESMPTISIGNGHVSTECHCAFIYAFDVRVVAHTISKAKVHLLRKWLSSGDQLCPLPLSQNGLPSQSLQEATQKLLHVGG
ncbi:hypothetical protein RJ639_016038 [Escallonia herrerae]|uniref:RING-type E3 ubiquitin transferase n=1 Tax=Escallonia herrerae TaxID=1293975 RepID=A0AA88VEN0_9ASTE|nr:hypothetical protein RJ639_016038 [Escallonia herrerae]